MRVNVNRISGLIKETTLNSTLHIPFKNEEFNIPKFISGIWKVTELTSELNNRWEPVDH